jgi:hypothetical protein
MKDHAVWSDAQVFVAADDLEDVVSKISITLVVWDFYINNRSDVSSGR